MTTYPFDQFEDDYDACVNQHPFPTLPRQEAAKMVFSIRYPTNPDFSYRFNRFNYICFVLGQHRPAIIQDRLAMTGGDGATRVDTYLLMAMHKWVVGLPDDKLRSEPIPDWPAILTIYDRIAPKTND